MSIIIGVYPAAGSVSHGSGRQAVVLPPQAGGSSSANMLYRVAWGTGETLAILYNRISSVAPVANRNQISIVNIVHDALASHFVQEIARPAGQAALRSMVVRCMQPGGSFNLIVSASTMTEILARGATYTQTFAGARAANARVMIADSGGRQLLVS